MKDTCWATYSSKYGWSVQKIWLPATKDDEKPPEPTCVDTSFEKKIAAVGYEDGIVRLFTYPVLDSKVR